MNLVLLHRFFLDTLLAHHIESATFADPCNPLRTVAVLGYSVLTRTPSAGLSGSTHTYMRELIQYPLKRASTQ